MDSAAQSPAHEKLRSAARVANVNSEKWWKTMDMSDDAFEALKNPSVYSILGVWAAVNAQKYASNNCPMAEDF